MISVRSAGVPFKVIQSLGTSRYGGSAQQHSYKFDRVFNLVVCTSGEIGFSFLPEDLADRLLVLSLIRYQILIP